MGRMLSKKDKQGIEYRKIENSTEFTDDPKKHFVRKFGWLPSARKRLAELTQKKTRNKIRYFTLCGQNAVDILYFKNNQLLDFDGRTYNGVAFCENNRDNFSTIRTILGRVERDFNKSFEDLVSQDEFKQYIINNPFDIYNLDFTCNCFPRKDAPFSRTLAGIRELIELQSNGSNPCNFDLFVTFRAERCIENKKAIEELKKNMEDNFDDHPQVKTCFQKIYKTLDVDHLLQQSYEKFLMKTFPKLIIRFGNNNGFEVHCRDTYFYPRGYTPKGTQKRIPYVIVKFIFSFNCIQKAYAIRAERRSKIFEKNYLSETLNYITRNPVDVYANLKANKNLSRSFLPEIKQITDEISKKLEG